MRGMPPVYLALVTTAFFASLILWLFFIATMNDCLIALLASMFFGSLVIGLLILRALDMPARPRKPTRSAPPAP